MRMVLRTVAVEPNETSMPPRDKNAVLVSLPGARKDTVQWHSQGHLAYRPRSIDSPGVADLGHFIGPSGAGASDAEGLLQIKVLFQLVLLFANAPGRFFAYMRGECCRC